ncbi:PorP/SprF family type IX secretion system membrane protein [Maribacter litopenaei]|uniref:PorP/SprF family type IX secretion system membrane protein n=1 Tax=Maribacter litopenaei TaxID=2976127 RepID=A0ABY5YBE8_9FLAO|nr:PorP/SprF family type IX secretion system membrane protein [Maribacter litopenaei]UWX56395.1 PorP/SprF family type IX secretion system membrane protein [Maribacter litopenaei]
MNKFCGALLIVFVVVGIKAQDVELPSDYRQHNLTEYNSNLLNPAFSLDRNNPSSIAFWSRWQWQTFDGDPTTLFFNYSHKLNDLSTAGLGFFQQNTEIFINTGIAVNYAYNIQLSDRASLGVGINILGFQQKLADQRFFTPNPIQTEITNDFIVQMAPGINVKIDKLSLGLSSENLMDYNISTNERNTSSDGRIFLALASYDFPVGILSSDENSVFRPAIYYKSIPGFDSQLGISTLLSTSKFWGQLGYNSFYGISGGVGGRFFKRFSLGALVEFGLSNDISGTDPSFEFVTSYKLGPLKSEERYPQEELIVEEPVEKELTRAERLAKREEEREQERLAKLELQRQKDSIREATRLASIELEESKKEALRERDSIAQARKSEALAEAQALERQRKQDSIDDVNKAKEEALALELQQKQDSINQAKMAEAELAKKEVVTPEKGERYEEVTKQGALEPGYYLIANVFGTKRYFDAFMADLQKKGLSPGSFYRETNKYNYVFLARYDSISEARAARDSNFGGKYTEKTWIFRVVGE